MGLRSRSPQPPVTLATGMGRAPSLPFPHRSIREPGTLSCFLKLSSLQGPHQLVSRRFGDLGRRSSLCVMRFFATAAGEPGRCVGGAAVPGSGGGRGGVLPDSTGPATLWVHQVAGSRAGIQDTHQIASRHGSTQVGRWPCPRSLEKVGASSRPEAQSSSQAPPPPEAASSWPLPLPCL